MYKNKYIKYKKKYLKQKAGEMWKEENKDLLDNYTNKIINQEEYTKHLFKRQYSADNPVFFYDKWNEHHHVLNPTNFVNVWKNKIDSEKIKDLRHLYREYITKPSGSGFYSPDENIHEFAEDFHQKGMQWDNERMSKWFRSSFYFSIIDKKLGRRFDNNDKYYHLYEQLIDRYPLIIELGNIVQRLKVLIEDILNHGKREKTGKTYEEYSVLCFYRDLVYEILSMFISLCIEYFIKNNINIRSVDIEYIYSLFPKLIKEGNHMFIFYIHEISTQLF